MHRPDAPRAQTGKHVQHQPETKHVHFIVPALLVQIAQRQFVQQIVVWVLPGGTGAVVIPSPGLHCTTLALCAIADDDGPRHNIRVLPTVL